MRKAGQKSLYASTVLVTYVCDILQRGDDIHCAGSCGLHFSIVLGLLDEIFDSNTIAEKAPPIFGWPCGNWEVLYTECCFMALKGLRHRQYGEVSLNVLLVFLSTLVTYTPTAWRWL